MERTGPWAGSQEPIQRTSNAVVTSHDPEQSHFPEVPRPQGFRGRGGRSGKVGDSRGSKDGAWGGGKSVITTQDNETGSITSQHFFTVTIAES